jgi:hypothetical protein
MTLEYCASDEPAQAVRSYTFIFYDEVNWERFKQRISCCVYHCFVYSDHCAQYDKRVNISARLRATT